MSDEKFPEVQPGQPIKASRANEEGRVLERVARMLPGTGMSGRHGGSILQFGRTHDARLATLKVTNDGDAPVYLGVFRQYDFESGEWSDGDKPWKIDAGAVDVTLSEDDIVVAYYDRKRGAFIPVVGVAGGVQLIRFAIMELQCDLCRATVRVMSRPPGVSSVWGESVQSVYVEGQFFSPPREYGEWMDMPVVTAYDMAGCYLKKPENDLLFKFGYAVLLTGMRHQDCEPDDYEDYGPEIIRQRWEIQAVCCDEFRCQDES